MDGKSLDDDLLAIVFASLHWIPRFVGQTFQMSDIQGMISFKLNLEGKENSRAHLLRNLGNDDHWLTARVATFAKRRQDHWILESVCEFYSQRNRIKAKQSKDTSIVSAPSRSRPPATSLPYAQIVTTSIGGLSLTRTMAPLPQQSPYGMAPTQYGILPVRPLYDPKQTYRLDGPSCTQPNPNFNLHAQEPQYGADSRPGSPHACHQYRSWKQGNPAIKPLNKDTASDLDSVPSTSSPPRKKQRRVGDKDVPRQGSVEGHRIESRGSRQRKDGNSRGDPKESHHPRANKK